MLLGIFCAFTFVAMCFFLLFIGDGSELQGSFRCAASSTPGSCPGAGSGLVQKVMLKVMEALSCPLFLPSQLLSCFSLLKKPHQYWVLKVGWSVFWNSGTLSDCPPLMMPSNPCSRCCVRTCTAAPLLFIAIPSCGFLPFYFSVCKFTFLASMNLQFVPHPPEPFTSCRERSNAWFSNLWQPQTLHRT